MNLMSSSLLKSPSDSASLVNLPILSLKLLSKLFHPLQLFLVKEWKLEKLLWPPVTGTKPFLSMKEGCAGTSGLRGLGLGFCEGFFSTLLNKDPRNGKDPVFCGVLTIGRLPTFCPACSLTVTGREPAT